MTVMFISTDLSRLVYQQLVNGGLSGHETVVVKSNGFERRTKVLTFEELFGMISFCLYIATQWHNTVSGKGASRVLTCKDGMVRCVEDPVVLEHVVQPPREVLIEISEYS